MKNFVRATGAVIEVQVISWAGPHQPESRWVEFEVLPPDPTHEQVTAAKHRALADRRYFDQCEECGALKPTGWMHDKGMCQTCAEQTLGIVH